MMSLRKTYLSPSTSGPRQATDIFYRANHNWALDNELSGYLSSTDKICTEREWPSIMRPDQDDDNGDEGLRHTSNRSCPTKRVSNIHYPPSKRVPIGLSDELLEGQSAVAADDLGNDCYPFAYQNEVPITDHRCPEYVKENRNTFSTTATTNAYLSSDLTSVSTNSSPKQCIKMEPEMYGCVSRIEPASRQRVPKLCEMGPAAWMKIGAARERGGIKTKCSPSMTRTPSAGAELSPKPIRRRRHPTKQRNMPHPQTRKDSTSTKAVPGDMNYRLCSAPTHLPSVRDLIEEVDALHSPTSLAQFCHECPPSELPRHLYQNVQKSPLLQTAFQL